jgi:hypothetical protein
LCRGLLGVTTSSEPGPPSGLAALIRGITPVRCAAHPRELAEIIVIKLLMP